MADFTRNPPATNNWFEALYGAYNAPLQTSPLLWFQGVLLSAINDLGAHYWSATTLVYKMRGQDAVANSYGTWLALGTPDFAARLYGGALVKPLRDVVVTDIWLT